ncbi:MAG: DoxX family membrane protein [Actinomycetota bacterium]|nr:DoxX family membrane protein [Actinomycetota bacterium]
MKYVTALIGEPAELRTPKVVHWLSTSKLAAVVWTAARIWLGVMWIQAGVAKLWGAENPAFLHNNGAGVAGFAAHGAASYSWWASFLHSFVVPNAGWIGVLVSVSEFAAGLALVIGLLTPVAAGGALILNLTYMLSGTAGVNPVYALFAVVLLATWRTSGWIGIDGLFSGYLARRRAARQLHRHQEGVVETLSQQSAA